MWSRVATKKSNLSIENTIAEYGKFIVIFYVKFMEIPANRIDWYCD